ncbi:MAG TPA: response regulator [Rhodopila sp.]
MAVARDGASGLKMTRAAAAACEPFDVALLDHQMPGNPGYEMAAQIRSDPTLAGMRVILATSQPSASPRAEAASVGVAYVLAKPIRQRMLIAQIQELVRGKKAPEAWAVAPARPGLAEGQPPFRVLVVDDVSVNRHLAVAMLTTAGHVVEVAADGLGAIEMIKSADYDLVLMDVQMPKMNGVAATAAIRGLPGAKSAVPIIAMTANAMEGDRENLIAAGMNGYISQPFTLVQLTELVNRWQKHRVPL